MRRMVLAAFACLILAAGPVPAAESDGGGLREAVSGGQNLRFEMPAGLCRIDPARGGAHAELWKRFTLPPQRNAELLALDLDCETVRAADAGKLQRPALLAHLLALGPDPEIGPSLAKTLDVLEERYGRLARQRGEAMPERDALAVYTLQDGGRSDGKPGLIGITAATLVSGDPLMFTVIDFERKASLGDLRSGVKKAIETLHAATR